MLSLLPFLILLLFSLIVVSVALVGAAVVAILVAIASLRPLPPCRGLGGCIHVLLRLFAGTHDRFPAPISP